MCDMSLACSSKPPTDAQFTDGILSEEDLADRSQREQTGIVCKGLLEGAASIRAEKGMSVGIQSNCMEC